VLTLALLFVPRVFAERPQTDRPNASQARPQLTVEFEDSFSADSREDYEITGETVWEKGILSLSGGASLERRISGSPWVRVNFRQPEGEQFPAQPGKTAFQLRFLFEQAPDCIVHIQPDPTGAASISLMESNATSAEDQSSLVRRLNPVVDDLRNIQVDYRFGYVSITRNDIQLFSGYIANEDARVTCLRVESLAGRLHLSALRLRSYLQPKLSVQEQQQMATATADAGRADSILQQGDVQAAVELHERSTETIGSLLGTGHVTYAQNLSRLALVHKAVGNFEKAEASARSALRAWQQCLGDAHPKYGEAMQQLALICQARANHAAAEPYFQQSLQIVKAAYGPSGLAYAHCVNNLAGHYKRVADYTNSERLYRECLDAYRNSVGEDHVAYATALDSLAMLYLRTSNFDDAEALFLQALTILRKQLGSQHPDIARTLNNLGMLYRETGNYEAAARNYLESKNILTETLGDSHPYVVSSLSNLAIVYQDIGDYSAAEPILTRVVELDRQQLGEHHPMYASSLNNLASLYQQMGDFDSALPLMEEASRIVGEALSTSHPLYLTGLNNLGLLHQDMGDLEAAEAMFNEALKISNDSSRVNVSTARLLDNLGLLYRSMGRPAKAMEMLQESSRLFQEILGTDHPACATTFNKIGLLYCDSGNLVSAEPVFHEALKITERAFGRQHTETAMCLNNIALLHYRRREFDTAMPLIAEAADIQFDVLNQSAIVQSERRQTRNQSKVRYTLDHLLSNAVQHGDASRLAAEAIWRWKGAVTVRQETYRRLASSPESRELFKKLRSVSRQLSALASRPLSSPTTKTAGQKHTRTEVRAQELTSQREDLERQIAGLSADYRHLQRPPTVDEVRSCLREREAYVDYLQYGHRLFDNIAQSSNAVEEERFAAIVVTREQPVSLIGLGPADTIARLISELRRPYVNGDASAAQRRTATAAAVQLRQLLWEPVSRHLADIDTVIIAPDTVLGTLPFAALPGNSEGSWLLEDYRLVTVPCARMLPRPGFELVDHGNRGMLLVGDIDYESATRPDSGGDDKQQSAPDRIVSDSLPTQWQTLEGFSAEKDAILRLFQKTNGNQHSLRTLTGSDAGEEEFQAMAPNFRTVHVVTHGYFASPDVLSLTQTDAVAEEFDDRRTTLDPFFRKQVPGLLSGLAMAGANTLRGHDLDPRDGILRATEIEATSLNGVDLVVLSACETGLGAVAGGEGLTGLQRAFQVAGARSVIASLWKVPDRATQELMTQFYTNLWVRKQSKIDALRNAQLYVMRHPVLPDGTTLSRSVRPVPRKIDPQRKDSGEQSATTTDPWFWAAWTLSGSWR